MGKSFRSILAVLLGVLALSACSSPAELQNMVVTNQSVISAATGSPFKNALAISQVQGGEETNPLWTSEVSGAAFHGALQASLKQNNLLADNPSASRFELTAFLGSLNQPLIGLDLTVSSTVSYRVIERKTKMAWFDDTVVGSYTAQFGDSLIAIQRLRFANEGSIRENIKNFISRLIATRPPAGSKPNAPSTEKQLRNLKKLLDDGQITQREYDRRKRRILKDL
ncbi:MAG: SHOCT domain-containing protein [Rhodospirillales bacterium]|nr:SHOCT domain-containing protein [Rhodospirillales bacterium]